MSALATASRSATELRFDPITPLTGAEVSGVDLTRELDAETAARIKSALHRHKVLVFRNQPINNAQHLRFSRYFGPLTPAHPVDNGLPDHPEIKRSQMTLKRKEFGAVEPDFEQAFLLPPRPTKLAAWHIDITFVANPNSISLLYGVEVPRTGGDTIFCNLEELYGTFSPTFQAYLDGLQAVHTRDDVGMGRNLPPRFDGRPVTPYAAIHPLVRLHSETGKKVLFFSGRFVRTISNLSDSESASLLAYLDAQVDAHAELHLRVRWSPNTLVVWDNQAVCHYGPIDSKYVTEERIMQRILVAGDLGRGPDGFTSRQLVGDLFNTIS